MKEVQILFDYLKNMKEITYNENCLEFYILLIFTLYRKEKRQINFYELMENIKLKLNFFVFLDFSFLCDLSHFIQTFHSLNFIHVFSSF